MRMSLIVLVVAAHGLALGGGLVDPSGRACLTYLQRVGVVPNCSGDEGCISNGYFSSWAMVRQESGQFDHVELKRSARTTELVESFRAIQSILRKGQGRTAVVLGKASPRGPVQMSIFGKEGFVATCRTECSSTDKVEIVACMMSTEVRDMMRKEECAERFPPTLFGLALDGEFPDSSLLDDDASVVMHRQIRVSSPRCKDKEPIKISHAIFTDMIRSFEKNSRRMISFELRREVATTEEKDRILGRIWGKEFPLAGFAGGREQRSGELLTSYVFERLDNICASLSVSDSGKGPALIRVVVELPEDFQVRNCKEKRRNGWQDPRLSEM